MSCTGLGDGYLSAHSEVLDSAMTGHEFKKTQTLKVETPDSKPET